MPTAFEALAVGSLATPLSLGTFNLHVGSMATQLGNLVEAFSNAGVVKNATVSGAPGLKAIYQNMLDVQGLSSRANSISAFEGQLAATFTYATTVKNVLFQSSPNASGSDVKAYISTVNSSLTKQIGTVSTFADALNGLQFKLNDLSNTPLKDGYNLSAKAIQWIADGASPSTSHAGNISYNGKNDYTFAAAATQAAVDILNGGIDFMNDSKKGLDQVVENKSYKDSQTVINSVLGIVSSVLGLGSTFTAIANVGKKISDAVSKGATTAWTYADAVKEGFSMLKGVGDVSKNGLAFAPALSKNYQGKSEIRWEADWGQKLRDVISQNFPTGVSSQLDNAAARFSTAFSDLMADMLRNMGDATADYVTSAASGSSLVDSTIGVLRKTITGGDQRSGTYAYAYKDFDGKTCNGSLNWQEKDFDKNGWLTKTISIPGYMAAEVRLHRWSPLASWGTNNYDLQVVAWNPQS